MAQDEEQKAGAKARKPTKNELRRARKKAQKQETSSTKAEPARTEVKAGRLDDDTAEIKTETFESNDPLYSQFASVFQRFNPADDDVRIVPVSEQQQEAFFDDDEDYIQDEEEEAETVKKMSKKEHKARNKLSVAELKAIVRKPEVVEVSDVSSQDPKLLVSIKSTRNVVPVPSHWSLKREYLSSKKGIEKPAYKLPPHIAETGIAEMRQTAQDTQADATLKQKMRARTNPKTNNLDMNYAALHAAFFQRQTKPHLTQYGELYYEGKEFEANMRDLRPGDPSDELRQALNLAHDTPPPWLIAMQRHGPPPSYPAMRIPGVTAPIPPGAKWGMEPGEWGRPPLDDRNKPKYGGVLIDTHGLKQGKEGPAKAPEPPVERTLWGELPSAEEEPAEEEESEEEEETEENEEQEDRTEVVEEDISGAAFGKSGGTATSRTAFSLSGQKSVAPDFNLRKTAATHGQVTDDNPARPRAAGQVLKERSIRSEGFFGGERAYDIGRDDVPLLGDESRGTKRRADDLDVSVDVDAMERGEGLSKAELNRQYNANDERERYGQWNNKFDRDDLSRMMEEEKAKAKRLKKS